MAAVIMAEGRRQVTKHRERQSLCRQEVGVDGHKTFTQEASVCVPCETKSQFVYFNLCREVNLSQNIMYVILRIVGKRPELGLVGLARSNQHLCF